MATDLHQVRPAPGPKKYEAFVETQLARARRRIRSVDLTAAALGWLALTLGYGLVLAICDRWLELPSLARQIAFGFYAAGSLTYLGIVAVRPLCRQINPYYAARRLEETIPEAKNSVVNWLDLHQQAIAPAFRSAISHQAAKDLADADLEQAISVRRASWLGGCAAALFLCMLVLFVLGPRQFISLMNRAFAPFVEASIATRTRILLVRPEDGDVTVPVGRAVGFAVWVEGRVPEPSSPDALKLLYRYNLSDPYQTRLLERGESSREWFANLLASEVHNGLWYKITGGDAETAEYHVQVRSSPLLTGFDVTYHYRPYLGWPDRTTHDQNLEDLRGTEVTLVARTNRAVKNGQLGIDGQKPIPGELVAEDPQALRFRLRLENDGSYRILFQSVEGETNAEPMAYTIRVLHDHPPQVELTKPGEDSQLPANGVLRLEGSASDDFGIARVNLRMKLENGALLQAKPYRQGQALRRGDGSYPQMLAYRDFVELDKLQTENGQPLEPLRPGDKLEYWLEGTDNCDYPGPNMGESKHFKVTIGPPDHDQKKEEQQRQQAQQEQQQHEKKQDHDLQNQKREPRQGSQEQKQNPNEAEPSSNKDGQPNEQDLNKQKEKIENAIQQHEQQQKTGDQGQSRTDKPQDSKTGDQGESRADKPQESKADGKGNGQSQQQSGKPQDKGKEGGESKPQSSQDNGGGKQDANGQKGDQRREGSAASESGSGDRKDGTQQSKPADHQGMKDGNREQREQTKDQTDGSNQGKQSPESRSGSGGERQAQDQAKPQAGTADKRANPEKGQGTAGEKADTRQEQKPGRDQEKGSRQGGEKDGQREKTAQPNPGQRGAGERPGSNNDQKAGERQEDRQGEGEKKPQSNPEAGNREGANTKPETGAKKNEKRASGQEGSKQESGDRNRQGEQGGANAGNAQQQNKGQRAGNEQGGQKENESNPAAGPEKRQEQGAGESRTDKTGASEGEPKTGEASPQREPKTGDGQGETGDKKATNNEKTKRGAPENTTRGQERPTGRDKGDTGDGARSKADTKLNDQKPRADGSQQSDKTQQKGGSDARSGQDDKNRSQQGKSASQQNTGTGKQVQDELSKLSKAMDGRDEKGRAEARKKLEELRDHAKDPAVRKAAADALDRNRADSSAQKEDGTQKGGTQGRPEEKPSSNSGEDSRGGEKGKGTGPRQATPNGKGDKNDQSDMANDRPKDGNRPDGKDDSTSKSGNRGNQAPSSSQPGGSGAGRRSGDNPTAQAPDTTGSPDNKASRTPPDPASVANSAYQKRAGELQLEDIKKRINKDVLKQLNMTEEDFQKFARAYEEMLKRKQPPGAGKENLSGPQRGNRSLPNQNVRAVAPDGQGKAGTLQRIGPALAPPEFRDAYKEFSRQISELEQKKENK